MELFSLIRCPDLDRVVRRKCLVVDRPPPVVLDSLVPALSVAVICLIVPDVNLVLALVTLYLHVVAGGERIDVDDAAVRENLVVDEWGEFLTTQAEP